MSDEELNGYNGETANEPVSKEKKRKDKNKKANSADGKRVKKHTCINSCLIFLMVCGILSVAVFWSGWFVGDHFINKNFGVGLGEIFSVYGSVKNYRGIEKEIEPYNEADSQAFLDSLADMLFLKSITRQECEAIINHYMPSGEPKSEQTLSTVPIITADGEEQIEIPQVILDIFREDNIDRERLAAYSDERIEDYYLQIGEKQLCAFIDDVLFNMLIDRVITDDFKNDLPIFAQTAAENIGDYVALSQIKISETSDDVRLKAVVALNLKDVLDAVKKDFTLDGLVELPSIVNKLVGIAKSPVFNFVASVLPSKIYVQADMSMEDGSDVVLSLNSSTAENIATVCKLVPSLESVFDSLTSADSPIAKAIASLNEAINVRECVENGAIKFDVLEFGLELLKINYVQGEDGSYVKKPESERITSKDVYYTLQTVLLADTDEALKDKQYENNDEYDYTKYSYKFENGKFVISYTGTRHETINEINEQAEAAFVQALSHCYGMDDSLQFADLMQLFGGEIKPETIVALFDAEKLKEIINGEAQGLVLSDQLVAVLVNSALNGGIAGENEYLQYVTPRYVVLTESAGHNLLEAGVELKIGEIIRKQMGDSDVMSIIGALLPETLLVSVRIDITPDCETYLPVELSLDKRSFEETARIVRIVDNLGLFKGDNGEKISFTDFAGDLLKPVREIIGNISSSLPGMEIGVSKLVLPDAYALIASVANANVEEGKKITQVQVKDSLKLLTDFNDTEFKADKDGLIAKFNGEYAMNIDATIAEPFRDLFTFFGIVKDETGEKPEFSELINAESLKKIAEKEGADTATFALGADEFAALIYEVLGYIDNEEISKYITQDSIRGIAVVTDNGTKYLEVKVKLNVQTLISDEQGFAEIIAQIFDDIMVTVYANLDGTDAKKGIVINDDEKGSEQLKQMLGNFGINISELENNIVDSLNKTMTDVLNSINGSGIIKAEFTAGENVFAMSNIFTVAANALNQGKTDETLKINASEVKFMLDSMLNSAFTLNADYDYNGYYKIDGSDTYKHESKFAAGEKKGDKIDFADILFGEIKTAYGIKETAAFDDVLAVMGIKTPGQPEQGGSQPESADIAELIDADALRDLCQREDDVIVEVDTLELSALIGGNLAAFVGNNELITSDAFKYARIYNQNDKQYIDICICVKLADLITEEANQFAGLLPEEFYITITVDITKDAATSAEIQLNDLKGDTTKLLGILKKIAPEMDFDKIKTDVAKAVRDGMGKLTDFGVTYPSGEGMTLPGVYALIASVANANVEEGKKITQVQVKDSLKLLTDFNDTEFKADKDGLIAKFNGEYAMNIDAKSDEPFRDLFAFFGIVETDVKPEFSDIISTESLKKIAQIEGAETKAFALGADEFAALIEEALGYMGNEQIDKYITKGSIRGIAVVPDNGTKYLEVKVKLDVGALISEEQGFAQIIKKIFTNVMVTAYANLDGTSAKKGIVINGNSEGTENLKATLGNFGINISELENNIVDSLNKAMNDILASINDSGIIKAEFTAGENVFAMSNIFEAATNVLNQGKTDEQKVERSDVKFMLDSLLNHPYTGEPVVYKGEYDNLFTAIKGAYAIKDDMTFDDVLAVMGIKAATQNKDILELIDGDKLRALCFMDAATVVVDTKKLSALVAENLTTFVGNNELITKDAFKHARIYSQNAKHYIDICVCVKLADLITEEAEQFAGLLPDEFYITITVDITKDATTSAEIQLNDLEEGTTKLLGILKKIAPEMDFDKIKTDVAKAVRDGMGKLTDFGVTYPSGEGIVLPDLFTAITKTAFNDNAGVTADGLKELMQGVYIDAAGTQYAIKNPIADKFDIDSVISSAIQGITSGSLSADISDKQLGRYVQDRIDADTELQLDIKQLVILPKGDTDIRNQFQDNIPAAMNTETTYILITVSADIQAVTGATDGIFGLLPKYIHINALIEYDETNKSFSYVGYRINNMSQTGQDALTAILGDNASKLEAEAKKCVNEVNDAIDDIKRAINGKIPLVSIDNLDITFGKADNGSGYGKLTLKAVK